MTQMKFMKTTKREDYAIVLMSALARTNEYVSLKLISDQYHLPYPFMKQISNDLVNAKLVETKGGSAGGYKLARSADQISWKEIMISVSGEPEFAECASGKGHICPVIDKCPSANAWRKVHSVILNTLDNVKLSDFVSK
jgi:Rrf2 family iron-sulfur cluster assembly transcriptional regulator